LGFDIDLLAHHHAHRTPPASDYTSYYTSLEVRIQEGDA
jgi:hypothetical protein